MEFNSWTVSCSFDLIGSFWLRPNDPNTISFHFKSRPNGLNWTRQFVSSLWCVQTYSSPINVHSRMVSYEGDGINVPMDNGLKLNCATKPQHSWLIMLRKPNLNRGDPMDCWTGQFVLFCVFRFVQAQ